MKALLALTMLFTLNTTYASSEGKVNVLEASYDAATDSINIQAEVSGIDYPQTSVRLRGCTDTFFPYTCFLDVNAIGDATEGSPTRVSLSYTREELNMKTRQFSDATLVIQNNKGKSRKYIQLPINR